MTTRARVLDILAEEFGKPWDEIHDAHTLADLGDSLEFLEALIVIENEYSIEITYREQDAANTVGKLVALVERKVGA